MDTDSLQLEKRSKIIHYEETPLHELQKKTTKKQEDSIIRKIDPSFLARYDKSLALNYSVQGTMSKRKSPTSFRNKCDNPLRYKSLSQRPSSQYNSQN